MILSCTYLYVCTFAHVPWMLSLLDLGATGPHCWTSQLLDCHIFHCGDLLQAPCRTQTSLLTPKDLSPGTQLTLGTSGVVPTVLGCFLAPTSMGALYLSTGSPHLTKDLLLEPSHSIGVAAVLICGITLTWGQLWRPEASRTNPQDHWTLLLTEKPETARRRMLK